MPFGRVLYVDIQAAFIRHKTLQEILEQTLRLRSYMQALWLRLFFFKKKSKSVAETSVLCQR